MNIKFLETEKLKIAGLLFIVGYMTTMISFNHVVTISWWQQTHSSALAVSYPFYVNFVLNGVHKKKNIHFLYEYNTRRLRICTRLSLH